jgi:hypothetical protein
METEDGSVATSSMGVVGATFPWRGVKREAVDARLALLTRAFRAAGERGEVVPAPRARSNRRDGRASIGEGEEIGMTGRRRNFGSSSVQRGVEAGERRIPRPTRVLGVGDLEGVLGWEV